MHNSTVPNLDNTLQQENPSE